ncbi:MAG: hypothetical protein B6U97_01100 [Candidatus Altiarchaeales archaeon ex4484_96]|nr:MAG: hypothetical protein B6U97_01100 [Candidatus Altiarchaeales archaeon ex4484_96]
MDNLTQKNVIEPRENPPQHKPRFSSSIRFKLLVLIAFLITVSVFVAIYISINSMKQVNQQSERISQNALCNVIWKYLHTVTSSEVRSNELLLSQVEDEVRAVASYTKNIFEKPGVYSKGGYWRAEDYMAYGPGGQYINTPDDVCSVFVPNNTKIDNSIISMLELSAYLDFILPHFYNRNQHTVAIYFMSKDNVVRYYPNVNFSEVIPPDFMITQRPPYMSAAPESNPKRKVVWTPVYEDATGKGLIITAVAPLYINGDEFIGVVGVDITLEDISAKLENDELIYGGYFVLLDDSGKAIYLPKQGYQHILGREPLPNESWTDLNNCVSEFKPLLDNMTAGRSGIDIIEVQGVELLVAYVPMEGMNWSLASVVQREKVLEPISLLGKQIESTTTLMASEILLTGGIILMTALIISLLMVNNITQPLRKLSIASQKISSGQLDVRLPKPGKDEIGELALAFSQMIKEVKSSRQELEDKVKRRTDELNNKIIELENSRLAALNLLEDLNEEQEKTEDAYDKLKESDKMKDEFMNVAAHELKTPLVPIKGYLSMMEDDIKKYGDQDTEKSLAIISRNLDRLENLIDDILDISKLESGGMKFNMEKVDIAQIINDSVQDMQSFAYQKGLSLELDIESNLPRIEGDRRRLIQVVTNLINNAIKFTEKGSIWVIAEKKDSEIVVSVKDEGIGIPSDKTNHLFTKFYQVDSSLSRRYGGTGLGLAICKGIIEHHWGRIWVESEMGGGSNFIFTIPVERGGYKRILYVEDDEDTREIARTLFLQGGYDVVNISTGSECIRLLGREIYDMLLINTDLSDMSGWQLYIKIKNQLGLASTMAVIFLSMVPVEEKHIKDLKEGGVVDYIVKPIEPTSLLERINNFFDGET